MSALHFNIGLIVIVSLVYC